MATLVFYLIVYRLTIASACLTTYVAYEAGRIPTNPAYQSMVLSATAAALCYLHVITLSALMARVVDMVKTPNDFRFWIDLRIIRLELFSTIFLSLVAFALQVASNCIYAGMTTGFIQTAFDCSIAASVFTGLICLVIFVAIINSYKIRKVNSDDQPFQGNI